MSTQDDVAQVSAIVAENGGHLLLPLECRSDPKKLCSRSQEYKRGWIVNKEGVRVAWVIFNFGRYYSLRYLRSSYVFDKESLQAKLDEFAAQT